MRRAIIVTFEGGTGLDVTGPAEVLGVARGKQGEPAYQVIVAASGGGVLSMSSGVRLVTRDLARIRPRQGDLVLVAGGNEAPLLAAMGDARLLRWLRSAARSVERLSSVCSGAFILAQAGLLDGKRAATHWLGCTRLAQMFPKVTVDASSIFVVDGNVWTSAGVTAGIDMALALVEADFGRAAADSIAASLVLYVRRPGSQAQFAEPLLAQLAASDPLHSVVGFIRGHLREANVESVARATGHSVRTLHRRCVEHLGLTPGKLVDRLRVEYARTLLATSEQSAKELATSCGFGSPSHLTRTFQRELGMSPRDYRLLHGS
jgi:transcriptional regulator GlxA family with amidase domain